MQDHGELRKYAVWLLLKKRYKNGVFYKFNINKIHKVSGLSRKMLKEYVKYFLDNKWCTVHSKNKNLCFISHNKLVLMYGIFGKLLTFVHIGGNTPQEILDNLRFEIFKKKDSSFRFVKKMSLDKTVAKPRPGSMVAYKKADKFFRDAKYKPVKDEKAILTISLSKLGNLIGRSPATAHNLIKKKVKEGVAKIFRTDPVKVPIGKMYGETPLGSHYHNGYLFFPVCNKYLFL
ncbi:MAG TPA: hypothetical protein PLU58_05175 [Saprospiraceae bacterium]|nr:hypothetical protein [Saprospiraceae bacterium]